MKDKIRILFYKATDACSVGLGCFIMAALFLGILCGFVYFLKWIWSFDIVKNLSSNFIDFIIEYGDTLEYVFVGAFLLLLFGCLFFGLITFFKDNKQPIINGIKTAWIWFLKILIALVFTAIFLFCLHECYRNSPDIVPERYEHRM